MPRKLTFPEDKAFALTIVDDTDNGTLQNLKPVYELLERYGIFITKTAWVRYPQKDPYWSHTDTLANPDYLAFVLDLKKKGFEIAWHGPAGESSTREQVIDGIARFEALTGTPVTLHVNHQRNLDNLYWGGAQLPPWRRAGPLKSAEPESLGHKEGSPYFWGDIARQRIRYIRGNSYNEINTVKCDPFMPYVDPRFPYANAWFSCSNGGNYPEFIKLLSLSNLQRLKRERGMCIVYTHFGSRRRLDDPTRWMDEHGVIKPQLEEVFYNLQKLDGWYTPATPMLDFLKGARGVQRLKPWQTLRLQLNKYVYRKL